MKEQFTNNPFSAKKYAYIDKCNLILDEYKDEGYTLTLRQLYYQLVARDIIPNKVTEYSKLSNILKDGRLAGLVDWSMIEDRIRIPKRPYWVTGIKDALNDTISQYRLNRMRGQRQNIEIWVEKDAVSNILYRISKKYHINLMVNRGYSSISAMYKASKRFVDGDIILYFGDYDPSGLDMIRDIKERLELLEVSVDIRPIGLTYEQIQELNPPPNPAKITDPRAKWYIEKFGQSSWELDALPPSYLEKVCEKAVLDIIDIDLYNKMIEQEQKDILTIKSIIK